MSKLDLEKIKQSRISREDRVKWMLYAYEEEAATSIMRDNEGDFLPGDKVVGSVSAAFAEDCNALYIGGWASRIEGKASDTWQTYCPGQLDELRFYNKALTAEEILALYKEEVNINLDEEE